MSTISGLSLRTFACASLVAAPLSAQADPPLQTPTPPTETGVFGTLGVGVASPGIGGLVTLSVHSARHAFVLRSSGASEFTLFAPSDNVEDYAFLYGRTGERERGWLRAAAGPAVVRVVRYGPGYDCWWFACSYDSWEMYEPGLALQADAVWTPGDAFGLGLTVFANINPEMPYAGVAVGVNLGKVRRR